MTKEEFNLNTSGMTTEQKYMCADAIGRLQVTYDIMMRHTNWKVTQMPLYSPYDLEVYDEKGELKYYIEVKDRWDYERKKLKTAFLNIPKYREAYGIKDKWLYANIFSDGVISYFKPYEMPSTGITQGSYYIASSTVENNQKKQQKRLELNFNDAMEEHPNKIEINFRKDGDGYNSTTCF